MPAVAGAVVMLTMLAIWLGAGVTLGEAARFGGYEVLYIFLPGWVLHEALQPRMSSSLRRVVFAFALGQVAEVLAFALTAGVGARWLFTLYPLAFLLPAALARARRRRSATRAAGPWATWRIDPRTLPAWSLALAAVCLMSLAYLALVHFLSVPLPGTVDGSFTYEHDYLFHLSLAGEALHHWPLHNPNVAGTALAYHWFSYIHIAAIAQVTGISLPTVYFALFQAPLLLLLLCELALAGETLGGKLWAGPLAALMLIFVGEIDLSKQELAPFLEVMPTYLRYSPSFLFAATMVVPLLLIVCEALQSKRPSRGQWIAIGLLAIGCSGGEGASLPLLFGGTGGYLGYRWLTTRRIDRQAVAMVAFLATILVAASVVIYGGGDGGLSLAFPATVEVAPPFAYELPRIPSGLHGAYWALSTLLLLAFLFGATLAGLFWLPRRLSELRAQEAVPLATFACGALALAFLFGESGSQEYFAMYGVIAVIPISAAGLVRMLSRRRDAPGSSPWPVLAFAAVCLAALWAIVFSSHLGASANIDLRYPLTYGILLAAVAALAIWSWSSPPPLRARRAIYPVIVVLAAALVNVPSDYRPRLGHLWSGEPVQAEVGPGLSPDLYEGLRWIESHTDEDAVLAVDNLRTPATREFGPLYFYISAFAERQTLMQGWEYTSDSAKLGFTAVGLLEKQPFPERLRLEDAVFQRASLPALRRLQRSYGVTDLVVDRATGTMTPRLRRIARLEYANPALLVFAPRQP